MEQINLNRKKKKTKKKKKNNRLTKEQLWDYKKNVLDREIAMQQKAKIEIDRYWKIALNKLKLSTLNEDVEVLWSDFERLVEKKDSIIIQLQCQMREIENQYRLNLSVVAETMRYLLNIYQNSMAKMSSDYNESLKNMQQRCKNDMVEIKTIWHKADDEVKIIQWSMAYDYQEDVEFFTGKFLMTFLDDGKNFDATLKRLRQRMENKYLALWKQFEAIVNSGLVNAEGNLKRLQGLEKKAYVTMCKISEQEQHLQEYQVIINMHRMNLEMHNTKINKKGANIHLGRQKEMNLRDVIVKEKVADRVHFLHLIDCCDYTMKNLNILSKKGERSLNLIKLCWALETEEEKKENAKKEYHLKDVELNVSYIKNDNGEYKKMNRFWMKVGQVDLEKKSLQAEKDVLMMENREFLESIRMRLANLTMDDGAIEEQNNDVCIIDPLHAYKNIISQRVTF